MLFPIFPLTPMAIPHRNMTFTAGHSHKDWIAVIELLLRSFVQKFRTLSIVFLVNFQNS
jgi:hypothetical protein